MFLHGVYFTLLALLFLGGHLTSSSPISHKKKQAEKVTRDVLLPAEKGKIIEHVDIYNIKNTDNTDQRRIDKKVDFMEEGNTKADRSDGKTWLKNNITNNNKKFEEDLIPMAVKGRKIVKHRRQSVITRNWKQDRRISPDSVKLSNDGQADLVFDEVLNLPGTEEVVPENKFMDKEEDSKKTATILSDIGKVSLDFKSAIEADLTTIKQSEEGKTSQTTYKPQNRPEEESLKSQENSHHRRKFKSIFSSFKNGIPRHDDKKEGRTEGKVGVKEDNANKGNNADHDDNVGQKDKDDMGEKDGMEDVLIKGDQPETRKIERKEKHWEKEGKHDTDVKVVKRKKEEKQEIEGKIEDGNNKPEKGENASELDEGKGSDKNGNKINKQKVIDGKNPLKQSQITIPAFTSNNYSGEDLIILQNPNTTDVIMPLVINKLDQINEKLDVLARSIESHEKRQDEYDFQQKALEFELNQIKLNFTDSNSKIIGLSNNDGDTENYGRIDNYPKETNIDEDGFQYPDVGPLQLFTAEQDVPDKDFGLESDTGGPTREYHPSLTNTNNLEGSKILLADITELHLDDSFLNSDNTDPETKKNIIAKGDFKTENDMEKGIVKSRKITTKKGELNATFKISD